MSVFLAPATTTGELAYLAPAAPPSGGVSIATAWTEAPDVVAIGATAGTVAAASISWTEAPDRVAMSASTAYANAPGGAGYKPRRIEQTEVR